MKLIQRLAVELNMDIVPQEIEERILNLHKE
jgi:transposase